MTPTKSFSFSQVSTFTRRATSWNYEAFPVDRLNPAFPDRYGIMSVIPTTDFVSTGFHGGPFSPASLTYRVQNIGGADMTWEVTKTAGWLAINEPGGVLAPGEGFDVVATIQADTLAAASYSDTLHFNNLTNGYGNVTADVELTVSPYTPPCYLDLSTPLIGGTGSAWANKSLASVAMGEKTANCLVAFTEAYLTPTASMVGAALKFTDSLDFLVDSSGRTFVAKIDAKAGDVISLSYNISTSEDCKIEFDLFNDAGTGPALDHAEVLPLAGSDNGSMQITVPSDACYYIRTKYSTISVTPSGTYVAQYTVTSNGTLSVMPICAPYTVGVTTQLLPCSIVTP